MVKMDENQESDGERRIEAVAHGAGWKIFSEFLDWNSGARVSEKLYKDAMAKTKAKNHRTVTRYQKQWIECGYLRKSPEKHEIEVTRQRRGKTQKYKIKTDVYRVDMAAVVVDILKRRFAEQYFSYIEEISRGDHLSESEFRYWKNLFKKRFNERIRMLELMSQQKFFRGLFNTEFVENIIEEQRIENGIICALREIIEEYYMGFIEKFCKAIDSSSDSFVRNPEQFVADFSGKFKAKIGYLRVLSGIMDKEALLDKYPAPWDEEYFNVFKQGWKSEKEESPKMFYSLLLHPSFVLYVSEVISEKFYADTMNSLVGVFDKKKISMFDRIYKN